MGLKKKIESMSLVNLIVVYAHDNPYLIIAFNLMYVIRLLSITKKSEQQWTRTAFNGTP